MPTSQEMRVDKTFNGAMDQINRLQKVFRDEGGLAKAVVDVGGSQDFGAIQEAFDALYGALEDAHYDAMGSVEVEAVKQKLGLVKEDTRTIEVNKDIELAMDSIWDRRSEQATEMVYVTEIGINEDEDGYVSVSVEHDGPWTIYTDTGFEEAISEIIGMEVTFSEQGMQEDGKAHLEGGDGQTESVAETTTDEDTEEEIKEQSPELSRLKQLIGTDLIREMKQ